MIYLKETLNLAPASPETRDDFISFAHPELSPAYERLGARLVGAWGCVDGLKASSQRGLLRLAVQALSCD